MNNKEIKLSRYICILVKGIFWRIIVAKWIERRLEYLNHGASLLVSTVDVVEFVEIVLLVDAGRTRLGEQGHGHVETVVELLDQIAAYEKAGSIEAVRAMHADQFGRIRANESLDQVKKQFAVFLARRLAMS